MTADDDARMAVRRLQGIDRIDAVGALVFRRIHLTAGAVEFEDADEVLRKHLFRSRVSGIKPSITGRLVENDRHTSWI